MHVQAGAWRFAAATLVALGSLVGTARAGSLTLTCELLSTGTNPSCPASAPMYAVPGQYNFVNSFSAPTPEIYGSDIYAGNDAYIGPAGFIDDYFFQITPATADAVSTTISESGSFSISELFARIYSLSNNPGGLVLTGPPVGIVAYATNYGSDSTTTVQVSSTPLTAGSYVLEISGLASGTMGGSYTGTLNLTSVPLPAALPLLLAGLGVLGGARLRSRKG
jgi:hypothetical protein